MKKLINKKNMNPLIMVSIIVAIPLILVVGIAIGSQIKQLNILASDSMSSWVSALATVAISVLTFILAKETWYLREAQIEQVNELRRESIRPHVSVALNNNQISYSFMDVEVSNLGKGIARNIRFSFSDREGKSINPGADSVVDKFLKLHVFNEGIHTLGIAQKINSFIFSFPELKDKVIGGDIFSSFFKITVSYEDTEGTSYENEIIIDFAEFKGISELGSRNSLYNISNDLKKIQENLAQLINTSSKRINVNIHTRNDREQEEKKRREHINELKEKSGFQGQGRETDSP